MFHVGNKKQENEIGQKNNYISLNWQYTPEYIFKTVNLRV